MHESQPSELAQLYETDYARWLEETAERLKARDFEALDRTNLIEEIEDRYRTERRMLTDGLRALLRNLLEWAYRTGRRTGRWQAIITEYRFRLRDLLADSPSLRPELERRFPEEYADARELAAAETGLPLEQFPGESPFGIEQVLDKDFWP